MSTPPLEELDVLVDGPETAPLTFAFAHGASMGMRAPFMAYYAEGLAAAGYRVVRFQFPFMGKIEATGRKHPPDGAVVLTRTWQQIIDRYGPPDRLVIAGKSLGGRMASIVADQAGVRGLVCMGYPFHPSGEPQKLRVSHLASLKTPTLILQGSRDPFGTREEVGGYTLSPAIRVYWLEDGEHSFVPLKKSGRTGEQNLAEALTVLKDFLAGLAS